MNQGIIEKAKGYIVALPGRVDAKVAKHHRIGIGASGILGFAAGWLSNPKNRDLVAGLLEDEDVLKTIMDSNLKPEVQTQQVVNKVNEELGKQGVTTAPAHNAKPGQNVHHGQAAHHVKPAPQPAHVKPAHGAPNAGHHVKPAPGQHVKPNQTVPGGGAGSAVTPPPTPSINNTTDIGGGLPGDAGAMPDIMGKPGAIAAIVAGAIAILAVGFLIAENKRYDNETREVVRKSNLTVSDDKEIEKLVKQRKKDYTFNEFLSQEPGRFKAFVTEKMNEIQSKSQANTQNL